MQQNLTESCQSVSVSCDSLQSSYHIDNDILIQQLNKAEEQAQYFRGQYQQLKTINEAMIGAIKQVLSAQIGQELELVVEGKHSVCRKMTQQNSTNQLTSTLYEMMMSQSQSRVSHTSAYLKHENYSPYRRSTSKISPQQISPQKRISPYHYKRQYQDQPSPHFIQQTPKHSSIHSFKDSGQISTNRSQHSPKIVKHDPNIGVNNLCVATVLQCQICGCNYGPNEFMVHLAQCGQSEQLSSPQINFDYGGMMRNLMQIREEIQGQIELLKCCKEKVNRGAVRKKLQKDLHQIKCIIHQKETQIKKRKHPKSKYTVSHQ